MRCFRTILKIRLLDRIPNAEVLRRMGNPTPLKQEILKRRLRWLGHVLRLDPGRHPKETFLFDPSQLPDRIPPWKRPRGGGVRKTWKRTVKDNLDRYSDLKRGYGAALRHKRWLPLCEEIASDRRQWKTVSATILERCQPPPRG